MNFFIILLFLSFSFSCYVGAPAKQEIGKTSPVCVTFSGGSNNAYAFNLKVDKMSKLTFTADRIILLIIQKLDLQKIIIYMLNYHLIHLLIVHQNQIIGNQ